MGSPAFEQDQLALANVGHLIELGDRSPAFYHALADRLHALSLTWHRGALTDIEKVALTRTCEHLHRELLRLASLR